MKTFGEMSREEKLALFTAWLDGKKIMGIEPETGYKYHSVGPWNSEAHYYVEYTPDYIDWSQVQPQYKWMARLPNGKVYLYVNKPDASCGGWSAADFGASVTQSSYKQGTVDWKDSLVERGE